MEDDFPVEGDKLPSGSIPLWIDVPQSTSQLDILKATVLLTSSRSVTVLHWPGQEDDLAAKFCKEKKWEYIDYYQIFGCEDEVVIAINCVAPEAITRPHNLLVIVTTPGAE